MTSLDCVKSAVRRATARPRAGDCPSTDLFTLTCRLLKCGKQAEGYISSGKAARLLNTSRIEFLALLRARGIAYINYTPEELEEEFAAVEALEIQTSQ